jgi:geranylgeranyl pyrophosphate synthase
MSRSRREWQASRDKDTGGPSGPGGAFERFAHERRPAFEQALARALPAIVPGAPALSRALAEAALSPGKRLRPLVAIAAGRLADAPREASMAVAVSVELVHAASLVLDDLPSMDDARRRRGRPALHVSYGIATAELASVALLARAFEIVAEAPGVAAAGRARIAAELARAIGADGCCGGQAADLGADPSRLSLEDLEGIHSRKTGALFVAAVRGGALAGGARESALESLTLFARNLGLAFQITDDLLDLEGDPEAMGKDTLRDGHRANFATLFGPASSRRLVDELLEAAVAALMPFPSRPRAPLADLARVVRDRRS